MTDWHAKLASSPIPRQPVRRAWQLYVAEFPDGRRYFGITCRPLNTRVICHKSAAKQGSPLPFHTALRDFGLSEIGILFRTLVIGDRDYIENLERIAVAHFNTLDRRFGYNVHPGGTTPTRMSPEGRVRFCAARNARKTSLLTRRRMSETRRKKIAEDPAYAESIRRMRACRGPAKPMSPEHKARLIALSTGRHPSAETRAKMSASHKGKKKSLEIRALLSRLATGKKHSPEARAKMSASQRKRQERQRAERKSKDEQLTICS
jgi:hypothetical protein